MPQSYRLEMRTFQAHTNPSLQQQPCSSHQDRLGVEQMQDMSVQSQHAKSLNTHKNLLLAFRQTVVCMDMPCEADSIP